MIKFFRKIRQKMLTEHKVSKYLMYSFGEIVLVVIGILIALQINNWNEEKKTQVKVNSFLTSLKSDLTNDLSTITEIIKIQEARLKNLNELISIGNDPNLKEIIEKDNITEINIGRNWTFFPVAGAYKAASGTGLIENLEKYELKNNIINLYEYYYNRLNYNGQLNDDRGELLEWESRKYINNNKRKLIYDANGLLDKDFLNQLGYVTRFTNVYLELSNNTKSAIENTIKSIKLDGQIP